MAATMWLPIYLSSSSANRCYSFHFAAKEIAPKDVTEFQPRPVDTISKALVPEPSGFLSYLLYSASNDSKSGEGRMAEREAGQERVIPYAWCVLFFPLLAEDSFTRALWSYPLSLNPKLRVCHCSLQRARVGWEGGVKKDSPGRRSPSLQLGSASWWSREGGVVSRLWFCGRCTGTDSDLLERVASVCLFPAWAEVHSGNWPRL